MITGIVLKARIIPPTPNVSAIVCRRPYFFGISKSIIVDGLYGIQRSVINTAHGEIAAKNAELQDDNGQGEKVKLNAKDLLAKYS